MVFDTVAHHLLGAIAPATAIDIGAGAGKYGRLLAQALPQCRRTAVEPESSYIDRFALATHYQRVHRCTAAQWQASALDCRHDLAILGDCIGQMPKSAGLDLLNFLVYRCAYVLVIAPEFVVQGAVGDGAGEAQVSVWSERDLGWHDLWAWDNCRAVTLLLLRGYQPATVSLAEVVERLNAGSVPIHEFNDRDSLVRPARLRLVDQGRETSYRPA